MIRYPDDPLRAAWATLLSEGLRIFDRSVASLQYLIDDEMRDLRASLLIEGTDAIHLATERLRGEDGRVARELRQIDEMDALDALAKPPEEGIETLLDADDDWRDFQLDLEKWLLGTLLMERAESGDGTFASGQSDILRFRFDRSRTLIPLGIFLERFQGVLDGSPPGGSSRRPLTFPYTYRRQTAAGRRGMRAGVRLLRYGEGLIDALAAMTELDDRGRAFAMWRFVPGYQAGDAADVFFRFDFVVEANVAAAAAAYAKSFAVSRRCSTWPVGGIPLSPGTPRHSDH